MNQTVPVAISPWLHPLVGGDPPPTWERLIRTLEAHTAASAADVATYRDIAGRMRIQPRSCWSARSSKMNNATRLCCAPWSVAWRPKSILSHQ